jgi:hypothetical protein
MDENNVCVPSIRLCAQIITVVSNNFWLSGGGPPLDEPMCGFTGARCDYRPYYFGGAALLLAIILLFCSLWARQR